MKLLGPDPGHDRYCDEIVAQTELLRECLNGADLAVTVPTCPATCPQPTLARASRTNASGASSTWSTRAIRGSIERFLASD